MLMKMYERRAVRLTVSFWIFPAREEWSPTCWNREGLKRTRRLDFCRSQCFYKKYREDWWNLNSLQCHLLINLYSGLSAYRIFLRVADFDPQDVVQQPIDGLLLVEHEDELNNEVQVWSLEHFSWRKERIRKVYRHALILHSVIKDKTNTKRDVGSCYIWICYSLPNRGTLQWPNFYTDLSLSSIHGAFPNPELREWVNNHFWETI